MKPHGTTGSQVTESRAPDGGDKEAREAVPHALEERQGAGLSRRQRAAREHEIDVSLDDRLREGRDDLGVVAPVGVEKQDHVARSSIRKRGETREARGTVPSLGLRNDGRARRSRHGGGAVARSVVDHDNVEVGERVQIVQDSGKRPLLVESRNDHVNAGGGRFKRCHG